MKNFIPVIRTDRLREMQSYEQKGYSFIDKKNYMMIEKIYTRQEGYEFEFGIEVTQNDVYFYLTEEKANVYLSIIELYHLLYAVGQQEGMEFVAGALKGQLRIQMKKAEAKMLNQEKFVYRNLEYEIRKTVSLKRNAAVEIPNIAFSIPYCELFMLLNLIQEKSNALFSRKKESKCYMDGILRLLIVLLTLKKDDACLLELGWRFDASLDQFVFAEIPDEQKTERGKRKYYLTKTEYKNILK